MYVQWICVRTVSRVYCRHAYITQIQHNKYIMPPASHQSLNILTIAVIVSLIINDVGIHLLYGTIMLTLPYG